VVDHFVGINEMIKDWQRATVCRLGTTSVGHDGFATERTKCSNREQTTECHVDAVLAPLHLPEPSDFFLKPD
jgi:hypothetical protein